MRKKKRVKSSWPRGNFSLPFHRGVSLIVLLLLFPLSVFFLFFFAVGSNWFKGFWTSANFIISPAIWTSRQFEFQECVLSWALSARKSCSDASNCTAVSQLGPFPWARSRQLWKSSCPCRSFVLALARSSWQIVCLSEIWDKKDWSIIYLCKIDFQVHFAISRKRWCDFGEESASSGNSTLRTCEESSARFNDYLFFNWRESF